jgi:hypothetical protein
LNGEGKVDSRAVAKVAGQKWNELSEEEKKVSLDYGAGQSWSASKLQGHPEADSAKTSSFIEKARGINISLICLSLYNLLSPMCKREKLHLKHTRPHTPNTTTL